MPSPYMGSSHEPTEMAEAKNVSPTSLKILAITDTLFVVAFGTDEQTLRMVSWRLDIHGTPVQLDSFTDPNLHVAQISLTSLNPSRQPREGSRGNQPSVEHQLATAIVDNKGCAHLISWTVSALGKIIQNSRQAIATNTAEQGDIRQVDVIADSQGRVFTSYVSKDGKMALSVWRIDVDKGLIQLHDNLIDDLIDDLRAPIGLCRECLLMGWEGSVISAVRSENGLVQLKSWAADPDGSVKMLAQSQPQFEDSEGILLCRNALDGVASIVTSSRDNQNRYRLVSWSVIS